MSDQYLTQLCFIDRSFMVADQISETHNKF